MSVIEPLLRSQAEPQVLLVCNVLIHLFPIEFDFCFCCVVCILCMHITLNQVTHYKVRKNYLAIDSRLLSTLCLTHMPNLPVQSLKKLGI